MIVVPEAFVDALKAGTGAIVNGPDLPTRLGAAKARRRVVSGAVVVRGPIRGWVCDEGDRRGNGLPDLLKHAARSGHKVFWKVEK